MSALVEAFEACTLAPADFRHRQHVEVAWHYLRALAPAEALTRFAANLRRFAAAQGKAGLYHETISWAYLLLINERRARAPDAGFDEFARANADLLQPDALARYYKPETLASPLAREVFLFPDGDGVNGRAKS